MSSNEFVESCARLQQIENLFVGGGAAEEEISAAERQLGVALTGEYREFLRRFGWARWVREEIFGLGADIPEELRLVPIVERERNKSQPRMRREFIPIRHDGGGNFDCLYLGNPKLLEPPVVLWDREEGAQQEPNVIAKSFGEWLRTCYLREIEER